jgi:ABC-2 type transport system permease protein
MQKMWVVARHEYWHHLRRKGFLISTFGMPIVIILVFALIVIVLLRSSRVDAIGYVDEPGLFHSVSPSFAFESLGGAVTMQRYPDVETASAQLRNGAVDAVFVIPKDYLQTGQLDGYAMESLPGLAEPAFTRFLRAGIASRLSAEPSQRVVDPVLAVDAVLLDAPPEEARSTPFGTIVPIIFGVIVLGSTFASGSYLMMAVAEEKEQRIMEILASSLSPIQMMAGKIIGLGALAITQLAVWSGGGACLFLYGAAQLGLIGANGIPLGVVILGLALFFPTYFIIAATLSSIGAAVTSAQQGQQLTGVVTLLCTLPLWFLAVIAARPNGWLAIALNLFPYTAPITLLQRVMTSPVPLWQQVATVAWLWVSAALLMVAAGRIVRIGLLRFGKRLSLREIGAALRRREVGGD